MNMDVKAIVDIDAFAKGMTFTIAHTGSIIPLAIVGMAQSKVVPMLPSPEYSTPLANAFFDAWKMGVVLIK